MTHVLRRGFAPVLAASALVLGVGFSLPAAGAATAPAQKATLTQTNRNCDGSLAGPAATQPFGFANITVPAAGKLVTAVMLKGATPNSTYNIRLIQLPESLGDCGHFINGPFDGTVTTDSSGNGSTNVQEPVLTGATSVFVDLNNQANPDDFLTTPVVTFQ